MTPQACGIEILIAAYAAVCACCAWCKKRRAK